MKITRRFTTAGQDPLMTVSYEKYQPHHQS